MSVTGGALCLRQEEHYVCDRRSTMYVTGGALFL